MATQHDAGGVPFSVSHDLQQFRLLELPAEVLQLIDSPNPPPLSIKSQAPAAASGAPNAAPAYAVLCTPDRSFQLRQVQTSNSVYIARPASEAHGNDVPRPTMSAVASCTATLELHATKETALAYLREALPVYDMVDGEVDAAENGKAKTRLFADIPLSSGECESGWDQLIAFDFAGSSWRPSANTLAQVWRAINSAALAESIKLDQQFLTEELMKAIDDEGYPADLVFAMFRHLAADNQDTKGAWFCLDRTKIVPFVGKTLLAAKAQGDYLTADFLDAWKDCIPEAWRADAELITIDGAYITPSSTTIALKGDPSKAAMDQSSKADTSTRKWHARFGRARK